MEDFCLQCDSPVTAMTLDKDKILCGLINAKVKYALILKKHISNVLFQMIFSREATLELALLVS